MYLHFPFIRQVNQLAYQAAKDNLDPFAAILVLNNNILASTADKSIIYADPTAHAELTVISEYCRAHQLISLEAFTLYCNRTLCNVQRGYTLGKNKSCSI